MATPLFKCFVLISVLVTFLVVTYFLRTNEKISPMPFSTNSTNTAKVILLWTPWFSDKKWNEPRLGKHPFVSCPFRNCIATTDRSRFMNSDLVLFHCCVKQGYLSGRKPSQVYAVECLEPPTNSGCKFSENVPRVNMTISHRLDSDIVKPYFNVRKRKQPLPGPYRPKAKFELKKHYALWPVSNCRANSKREIYVRELGKFLDVHIFGPCGDKKCSRQRHSECYHLFEQNYKFYLSFENSVCKDYITEKVYEPLLRDLVPIVLGGADYKTLLPPKSYIDIKDFSSPRHLADYLHRLSKNESEYNEYFQWKLTHTIHPYPTRTFCELCETLHGGTFHRDASQFDVVSWWNHNTCEADMIKKYMK